MSACGTCSLEDSERERLEACGFRALKGEVSWREAARLAGLNHHTSLKTHMEKHTEKPVNPTEAALADVDDLIAETIEELKVQMRMAPVEVKAFYATAIRNLAGLMATQPSQANLIGALKAIHEVTGMKMEQRMMLQFAQQMFAPAAPPAKALPDGIVDLEPVHS